MFDSNEGKRCPRCELWKRFDQFAWRRKAAGIRQVYCRSCMAAYNRVHYRANKQLYIDRARRRTAAIVHERAALLVEFFRTHPCLDCGETDPLVLEFDHIGEKAFSISQGLRDRGWQRILEEIEKCEVVCANCHRRRTASRAGFARWLAAGQMA